MEINFLKMLFEFFESAILVHYQQIKLLQKMLKTYLKRQCILLTKLVQKFTIKMTAAAKRWVASNTFYGENIEVKNKIYIRHSTKITQ